MASIQKSIRLPEQTVRAIELFASDSGGDFSAVARDLLVEAVKMRKCPGVVFADGPTGRRARIAGTGIDVWELVAAYKALNQDSEKLRKDYHWLSDVQIRAALAYYALYPEEIDARIKRNEEMAPEEIAGRFPFIKVTADKG